MEKNKHGDNCNCPDCVNKRRQKGDMGLTYSCGHCHEENHNLTEKVKGEFIKLYGLTIYKLVLSFSLLIVAIIINFSSVWRVILCIISLSFCGVDVLISCLKGLIKKDILNENTLMLTASIVAFILGEYLESVLIVNLFTLGELFERIATSNTKKRIAGLSKLKILTARKVTSFGIEEVSCEQIEVGSLIEVRKGDRVAIDGEIFGVGSYFDMKMVTGESKGYSLNHGDKVYSGAINLGDSVIIKTTKLYKDSTVEKIISLVEGANSNKAKSQKFITNFAKIYTPVIFVIALIIGIVPPLFNGEWQTWIFKSLSFLVVSCPCALVISVPLGFFIGIGSLSKRGILVKGSNYIDVLTNIDTVVFDKTGTLTKGNFEVVDVKLFNDYTKEQVVNFAGAVENSSSHPIAKAISSKVTTKLNAIDVKEIAGKGISGYVERKLVIVGNKSILDDFGIKSPDNDGIFVVIDNSLAGIIQIEDQIKENAKQSIEKLKKLGVSSCVMISGDNKRVCDNVANSLNLDEVHAEVMPDVKSKLLGEIIQKQKNKVMFVGDGINDAPSIALADVGVSMGGLGSDIAIESADVVILDDDLNKIPYAMRYSRRIKRKVIENIVSSLFVKFAIMLFSVLFTVPIWLSLIGDVGVMLLAVLNSLTNYRLLKDK